MLETKVDGGLETRGLSLLLELALGYKLFLGVSPSLARSRPKELNGFSSQHSFQEAVGQWSPSPRSPRTSLRGSWAWPVPYVQSPPALGKGSGPYPGIPTAPDFRSGHGWDLF